MRSTRTITMGSLLILLIVGAMIPGFYGYPADEAPKPAGGGLPGPMAQAPGAEAVVAGAKGGIKSIPQSDKLAEMPVAGALVG